VGLLSASHTSHNEIQKTNTRRATSSPSSSFLSARQQPLALPVLYRFHFVLLMWGKVISWCVLGYSRYQVVCPGLQSTDCIKWRTQGYSPQIVSIGVLRVTVHRLYQVVCSGLQSTDCIKAFLLPRCNGKGKAIPLHSWTGPEDSMRLRLPDFKTIGT
jgi:hypothetical protein